MLTESGQIDYQRRSLPAWLISLCVHLALLTVLAVAVRAPQSHGLTQRDREVGIALAQVGDSTTEYFDESSAASSAPSESSDAVAPLAESDALPSESEADAFKFPDLTLPGPAASAPTAGLIPDLEYSPVQRGGTPSATDIKAAREEDAAMRSRQGTRGPSTEVSLFGGAAAVGNSFIFVVDRSDSMGRGGLGVIGRARREFQQAVDSLESVHRFQIVGYNHQLVYFGNEKELVPATDPNKRLVSKFMGGLAAFGSTNHFSALMSALYRSPDVIFLLTDGGEPPLSHPQMVQVLKLARGKTTIHGLQFGRGPSDGEENFMHRLARETGGTFRYLNVMQMK